MARPDGGISRCDAFDPETKAARKHDSGDCLGGHSAMSMTHTSQTQYWMHGLTQLTKLANGTKMLTRLHTEEDHF